MRKLFLGSMALAALGASPALAADMPVKASPLPVYSWTGWYAGVNAGGNWNTNNSVTTESTLASNFTDPSALSYGSNAALGASGIAPAGSNGGFIGGAQFGYNWQIGGVGVVGFEADIQGIGKGGNNRNLTTVVGPFAFDGVNEVITTSIGTSQRLDYLGTVRGRLGVLATPSFLLYGTGGLAFGGARASTSIFQSNNDCALSPAFCIQTAAATAAHYSNTRAGWTAGVGAEWMFGQNWSAKLEYLYYDLGSTTFPVGALVVGAGSLRGVGGPVTVVSQSSTRFSGNIARVGVNYHFGGPPVAKY